MTLQALARGVLRTLAKEDMKDYRSRGFYTTITKAGYCKVLMFDWPREQKKLDDFNLWRNQNGK